MSDKLSDTFLMLALHCKYDESVSKEVSFENIRCVLGSVVSMMQGRI